MTEQQKEMIAEYRTMNFSYTAISKEMGISINSIKTYCKRHGLGGKRAIDKKMHNKISICECCGIVIKQNVGRKKKRFCSDKCRCKWWYEYRTQTKYEQINHINFRKDSFGGARDE